MDVSADRWARKLWQRMSAADCRVHDRPWTDHRLNRERQLVARNVGRAAALSADGAQGRRGLPSYALRDSGCDPHGDLVALTRLGAIGRGQAFNVTGYRRIGWARPAGPLDEAGSTSKASSSMLSPDGNALHA